MNTLTNKQKKDLKNKYIFCAAIFDSVTHVLKTTKLVCIAQTREGRIYKDLDTGEISPEVYTGKELQAWYLNRDIFPTIF